MQRNFKMGDLKEVQKIAKLSLYESYSLDVFILIDQAFNCEFIVHSIGGEVAGFINGVITSEDGARILMLAVHPSWRRRGIGSSLLDTFVANASRRGMKKITLEVRPSNDNAIEFYMARGFEPVGTIDNFYTDGERCINMVRYL